MTAPATSAAFPVRRARRGASRAGRVDRPGLLTYGLLSAFILGSTYPLWWSFVVASGSNATRSETLPLVPGGNFLANAAQVLTAIPFWTALLNSVLVSGIITLSVVSFSTLAGYAFAKLRFRGRDGLMIGVVATMAIPTQLGIIPLFILMRELGWTGSLGAVIVPTLVTAFGVFFMRQYLVDVIPDELIEAARMDGANQFRTFLTVAVPAARPAMAILGLFTFMMAWTDFLWPLIVLSPTNPTLQTALAQLQSGYYVDYSIVLAGAVLSVVPLLVLFLLAGRQLIAGIMSGAVKG
ncbi:carbohydrate ABC transporter permease [Rathayibacter rathayi]|uniref:Carbohydrate ABC transporter permease n=1 Tax=Rathayibacter rathayi TaxID=33887 RepID=A0ABX5ADY2_RATRA|nr:carbohydrate ABC transporter permease [Rathayibacter rathayi]AZZ50121.1 carbohydrate ABC transporter permease [Rathayibacter rathayi]MWV74596.1 ABC transporter permease subunit [Rathayibacter rathayi NCPPB 2980 = VKM Ac-1601]PPF49731.1 carbohydrate ABC transporter permease [Rathayibacter rathayi]PPG65723.1 carbohydrate ABC transporter permease [Rathayibacter rathayi]PPG76110.1 carbohydrate ABC transporter permease [Rathayibacter rathayi]